MNVYDVTIYTKVLTKEQVKYALSSFWESCNVSDEDILKYSDVYEGYEVRISTIKEINMREHTIGVVSCAKSFDPDAYVRVCDARYVDTKQGVRWVNEGVTAYDAETVYTDPFYSFYIEDWSEYRIIDVKTYIEKISKTAMKSFPDWLQSCSFAWSCNGCWYDLRKAKSIDDAIEEFEGIYLEKLRQSVEGYMKSLDKATDAFREFDQYRWNKMR